MIQIASSEEILGLTLELEGVYSIEEAYYSSLIKYFEKFRPQTSTELCNLDRLLPNCLIVIKEHLVHHCLPH
jgi:hypothetical protein